jgi:RNA polymerase sigma factor (sigma-70 family)
LYQTGCLALCESTRSYDGSVQFRTYAQVVVRNKLIDHCRRVKRIQDKTCYTSNSVPDSEDNDYNDIISLPDLENDPETKIDEVEINILLQKLKNKYSGITLKGIEAIELKIKGYSGVEIAALYGVKPNLLGAWISKAKKKIKQDTDFIAAFPEIHKKS